MHQRKNYRERILHNYLPRSILLWPNFWHSFRNSVYQARAYMGLFNNRHCTLSNACANDFILVWRKKLIWILNIFLEKINYGHYLDLLSLWSVFRSKGLKQEDSHQYQIKIKSRNISRINPRINFIGLYHNICKL